MIFEDVFINGFRVRVFQLNGLKIGVALDFGPRILYLGLNSESYNLFNIIPEVQLETPDGIWRIYGGHRLWTAPEDFPRTYTIDDKPVYIDLLENRIIINGNPDYRNNVLKKIQIEPGEKEYTLKITHEITNIGRWPIEYACWAISVMQPRGLTIIPLKPKRVDKYGLLPDRVIAIWPYTRLDDPRLVFRDKYMVVKHDPSIEKPFKIGARANPPLLAYWVDEFLFIKRIKVEDDKYPDYGVTVEVYANDKFLELETLGPLKIINPGESNKHVEEWEVKKLKGLRVDEEHIIEEVLVD
ncbi:MAG: hypothetical protein QXQ71_00140 [Desulfurococcaceae archaeon]